MRQRQGVLVSKRGPTGLARWRPQANRLLINSIIFFRQSSGVLREGVGIVGTLFVGGDVVNDDCPGEPRSGRGGYPPARWMLEVGPLRLPKEGVGGDGFANTLGLVMEPWPPNELPAVAGLPG